MNDETREQLLLAQKQELLAYADDSFEKSMRSTNFQKDEYIQTLLSTYDKDYDLWIEIEDSPYTDSSSKMSLRKWLQYRAFSACGLHPLDTDEWDSHMFEVGKLATALLETRLMNRQPYGFRYLPQLEGYNRFSSNGYICSGGMVWDRNPITGTIIEPGRPDVLPEY